MNLKEQLIEKMEAEFEHFHSWLLEQPPEEILDLAYDYLTKQDILMNLEDTDLSPAQIETMLRSPCPLEDVLRDCFHIDQADYNYTLKVLIDQRADMEMEKQRAIPIYNGTAREAKEQGELDKFKASAEADENCKTAIENAIARNYDGSSLNTSAAIVSQVQQVSALIPSFLGGAEYSFFGIRPMMAVSVAAFAGAAAIECFIRLGMPERDEEMPTPLDDLKAALRFLTREKPNLLKMVLLASALNFVVLGYGAVGYAFVIRTQWGFDATVYGIADGLISVAALMGMLIVTMMAGRLKIGHMTKILTLLGLTVIPQGVACMLSGGNWTRLMARVAFACIGDVICSCANIIAVPAIQMRTPDAMLGKVMALLSALAMCMQPLGQMAYGWAFDHLPAAAIFIASGAVLIAMALLSASLFAHFDD